MKSKILPVILVALAGGSVACGGENTNPNPAGDSGVDLGTTDAGHDSGPVDPCAGQAAVVDINANITANTTWCTGHTYRLMNRTYVVGGVTLTIQPGVTVTPHPNHLSAQFPDAALVITQGSHIDAQGTAAQPIVFTSYATAGSRNDPTVAFGGLVMFGNAPVNSAATAGGSVTMEGLNPLAIMANGMTVNANDYGGNDPSYSCGTLKYVRVEFGGYVFAPNKEFNGITLGGCGSGTQLSYVQVHRAWDDGIECFGGSPNLDHIVVTGPDDDGFDWDNGFSGHTQYYIVHQYGTGNSDKGIEADNNAAGTVVDPRTNPIVYNMTLVGSGVTKPASRCLHMRRATLGRLHHFICDNWGDNETVTTATTTAGVFFEPPTVANEANFITTHWPTDFVLDYSYLANLILPTVDYTGCSGGDCVNNTTMAAGADGMPDVIPATAGIAMVQSIVTDVARHNSVSATSLLNVGSVNTPNYCPAAGTATITGDTTTAPWTGFDTAGLAFAGACAPGTAAGSAWYDGWTSFPNP